MPIPHSQVPNPINTSLTTLLNDENGIAQAVSSPAGILQLVNQEANLLGLPPEPGFIWPIEQMGKANNLIVAGIPNVEKQFHASLLQGQFHSSSLGEATHSLQVKMLDLDEKIQHYLSLNRLALDGQFSDTPRALKFAKDSVSFIQKIQTYITQSLALVAALKADVVLLQAIEARMVGIVNNNIISLTNLLNEICNWGLPKLPSLAAIQGRWHWDGFNFNLASGFRFSLPSLASFDANFSFAECKAFVSDFSSLFGSSPTSIPASTLPLTTATPPPPLNGAYGDPAQLTNPTYIAQMETTPTAVFNPGATPPLVPTSLPDPAAIISNYSLPAATYTANIVSAVAALNPIVVQPQDADYGTTASTTRQANLAALMVQAVNLDAIVASNYDQNLTAAWLLALSQNRIGRAGIWLPSFQNQYILSITPSVSYVQDTPVPFNQVLGSTTLNNAPIAIPLIAQLQQDTTNNLKWRLTFIEADLLGYPRSRTWDAAADTLYTGSFTGPDLDYVAAAVTLTPTTTVTLGQGTATYPVLATVPQSILTMFNQVVTLATANIQAATTYLSPHAQNRFTYNIFAQATLIDRFTQFWRDFNANLVLLLAQDPYVVAFVANYVACLNSAINPLASSADYLQVEQDALSRNRNWLPGSILLPIPQATAAVASFTAPTELTNGWTQGSFDAPAFLARPDIQAQSLPVQMAMLRTNQSFNTLMNAKADLQASVANVVTNAQNMITSTGMPGWGVETAAPLLIPPTANTIVTFGTVDFDQSNYVQDNQTIDIQTAGPYLIYATLNWDPAGDAGARKVSLLQNGTIIATTTDTMVQGIALSSQVSIEATFAIGDILQVETSHSLTVPESLLAGSTFTGLLETVTATNVATAAVTPTEPVAAVTTLLATADALIAPLTAVTIQPDGGVLPLDPTITAPGVSPYLDGVAVTGAAQGQQVTVAASYGQVYEIEAAGFTPNALLYINEGGGLTQNYTALTQNVRWIICIGRALTATTFLYQPHLPVNYTLNF